MRLKIPIEFKDLVEDFRKRLVMAYDGKLVKLVLFGSCLKSAPQEGSDVDLAVIIDLPVTWKVKRDIWDLAFETSLKFLKMLHVTVIEKSDLTTRPLDSLLLIESISREGVTV